MKKERLLLGITIMLFMFWGIGIKGSQKVEAAEAQRSHENFALDERITPYADVIETKFRVINGVTQYRRWNKTKGYWVDSDWITL